MTSPVPQAPPPRRSDPTRARILEAARRRFARAGYEATTIRAVAADAGIDPSMVMRYYGSKDGLFAAAADLELHIPDLREVPRRQLGRRLVRHFFERWESRPGESPLGLLLRTAGTNELAAERLRSMALAQVAAALEHAGVDQPERRAGLIASQMIGLGYCRYVLALPAVVALTPDELVADVGATIQRYITGPLAAAG
jgi:AcrR family transcriptional regulator